MSAGYPNLAAPTADQALAGYTAMPASAPPGTNPYADSPVRQPAFAPQLNVSQLVQPQPAYAQPPMAAPVAQPVGQPVFAQPPVAAAPVAPVRPMTEEEQVQEAIRRSLGQPAAAVPLAAQPPVAVPLAQPAYAQPAYAQPAPAPPALVHQASPQQMAAYPAYAPPMIPAPGALQVAVASRPRAISVQESPSGFGGGMLGAVIGTFAMPVVGTAIGAFVGRKLQRNSVAEQRTVYIRPQPNLAPVPVKLWKLGLTAPLTEAGMQLVVEARSVPELDTWLHRLIRERGGIVLNAKDAELYVSHLIALANGGQALSFDTVLRELSTSPWCRGVHVRLPGRA